ncbi:MAG TPA: hypothetical protein PLJ12_11925, partial [Planctomycetota bacterium]|nr:hypothetical protein [Planctomycetota bacterium]
MRLLPWLGVGLVFASAAFGNEVIVVRSGSFGGNPAAPGVAIDNGTCLAAPLAFQPLSASPFVAEFSAALAGPAPYVVNPNGQWLPSLPCDPEARWINSEIFPGDFPDARSTLYCFPFTISTTNICEATIRLCWAGDDALGDPSGPNSAGAYINGSPLNPPFSAGSYATQTSVAQTITGLVNPGVNYLYLYQRDLGGTASGLLFSATIEVSTVSVCVPGVADSVLVIASGQYQGAPQVPGGPVDDVVCIGNGVPSVPYQTTYMSPSVVEAVCGNGTIPVAITPFSPDWTLTLPCNPNARWIHTSAGVLNTGQPAQSVLYCIPFQLPSTIPLDYCSVGLELCWAADDTLGDPSGPNAPGAFVNGVALPPQFWGGNYAAETSAATDITSMIYPGL